MAIQPFAEIILDTPTRKLDRVFHYRVPESLANDITAGMRVIVPFGAKTLEGYVVGFSDKPEVEKVKDIIDIADQNNAMNHDLMVLAGWLAEKYMCSKAEAFKCMVPSKAGKVSKWISATKVNDLFREQVLHTLKNNEKELFKLLDDNGTISFEEARKKLGSKSAEQALHRLKELGLARISGETRNTVKRHIAAVVDLAETIEPVEKIIEKIRTKAPKQAEVLNYLQSNHNMTVQELAKNTGTTASTVRELIKKGFLVTREVEIRRNPYAGNYVKSFPLQLNKEQENALQEISKALDRKEHEVFLLHGITGSGKTEVYLQTIAHCLANGRQAIVLVPEISLTPQTVERFKSRFGDRVAVLHSRLSDGERFDEWRMVKSGQVQIVVGARSAVFAPFNDLGLIVIDEEHESSYKQEDNPKYHAREAAIARAKILGAVVVMGSATPSLETYTRAKAGKYRLLTLKKRVMDRPLPEVIIVDLREEMKAGHRNVFSRELIDEINNVLAKKEKIMLFLNRRGFSTFVVCRECGYVLKCPRCSITLTLHAGHNQLRCHYCDYTRTNPDLCPKCGSKTIRHFGIGTQKVEQEAARLFPDAVIARMDMDTTVTKGAHEKILGEFKEGKIDILVGTQMIAKGLDFPDVTLVGVITADTSLNLPDYKSSERTFQLLTQVAGRAGRGEMPGKVIVQTYNPEHYSIICAGSHDYRSFYIEEMKVRDTLGYPPYSSLIRILIHGTEENSVIRAAEAFARKLSYVASEYSLGFEQVVLGPAPAPINKIRNRYRWQICVRGRKAKELREICGICLNDFNKTLYSGDLVISVDVDPVSII